MVREPLVTQQQTTFRLLRSFFPLCGVVEAYNSYLNEQSATYVASRMGVANISVKKDIF